MGEKMNVKISITYESEEHPNVEDEVKMEELDKDSVYLIQIPIDVFITADKFKAIYEHFKQGGIKNIVFIPIRANGVSYVKDLVKNRAYRNELKRLIEIAEENDKSDL